MGDAYVQRLSALIRGLRLEVAARNDELRQSRLDAADWERRYEAANPPPKRKANRSAAEEAWDRAYNHALPQRYSRHGLREQESVVFRQLGILKEYEKLTGRPLPLSDEVVYRDEPVTSEDEAEEYQVPTSSGIGRSRRYQRR